MCFSENMSLAIGMTGLLTSIYYRDKNINASLGIGYFALMEILQYFQYKVINQCNNKYNKLLTNIGYVHICFQPLFFNIWLYAFTEKKDYKILYMSFLAGILLLSRLFNVKDDELCDTNNEPLCGYNTCSFSGKKHIAWNIRLRTPGKKWFTPSIGLHFFMWVIPILTNFELKPIIALLITAPYFGLLLTDNIHEQPAIWCYTAIGQMILTYYFINKPIN